MIDRQIDRKYQIIVFTAPFVAPGRSYLPPQQGGGSAQQPSNQYGPPSQGASQPSSQYGPPNQGSGSGGFGGGSGGYSGGAQQPSTQYGPPSQGGNGGSGSFGGRPSQSYGAPSQGNYFFFAYFFLHICNINWTFPPCTIY